MIGLCLCMLQVLMQSICSIKNCQTFDLLLILTFKRHGTSIGLSSSSVQRLYFSLNVCHQFQVLYLHVLGNTHVLKTFDIWFWFLHRQTDSVTESLYIVYMLQFPIVPFTVLSSVANNYPTYFTSIQFNSHDTSYMCSYMFSYMFLCSHLFAVFGYFFI